MNPKPSSTLVASASSDIGTAAAGQPATSPGSRLEQVVRAFLTPGPPRQPRPLALDGSRPLRIATPEGEVALQVAGSGPSVMLLHGWEGQPSDLAAFAPPLLAAGCSVVTMDLPAHGASDGRQTSIPQAARALGAVVEALGPLHGVIAHSMGAEILVEALFTGLAAERVVLISAPAYYERFARNFAAGSGLDAQGTEAMLTLLGTTIGVDVHEISVPLRAAHLRQPALIIHSGGDRLVAIEDSLASAAAWPGARHLRVEGLGHGRILADPAVVAAATAFVTTPRTNELP